MNEEVLEIEGESGSESAPVMDAEALENQEEMEVEIESGITVQDPQEGAEQLPSVSGGDSVILFSDSGADEELLREIITRLEADIILLEDNNVLQEENNVLQEENNILQEEINTLMKENNILLEEFRQSQGVTIWEKDIDDYTPSEGMLLIILVFVVVYFMYRLVGGIVRVFSDD